MVRCPLGSKRSATLVRWRCGLALFGRFVRFRVSAKSENIDCGTEKLVGLHSSISGEDRVGRRLGRTG
jgi:hypothetical protein